MRTNYTITFFFMIPQHVISNEFVKHKKRAFKINPWINDLSYSFLFISINFVKGSSIIYVSLKVEREVFIRFLTKGDGGIDILTT